VVLAIGALASPVGAAPSSDGATGDDSAKSGCAALDTLSGVATIPHASLDAAQVTQLRVAAEALRHSKTAGAGRESRRLGSAATRSGRATRNATAQARAWCVNAGAIATAIGADAGTVKALGATPFGSAGCAQPNPAGWQHWSKPHALLFTPNKQWNVVDAANSTQASSPLGDAKTSFAFAADPFGVFHGPTEVADYFLKNGAIRDIQILDQDQPYAAEGGGMQQDFEFIGTDQGELYQPGASVHGWASTYYLAAGDSSFFVSWLEVAHTAVADDLCGTLFEIRLLLKRI
jgi:hypothetical protein